MSRVMLELPDEQMRVVEDAVQQAGTSINEIIAGLVSAWLVHSQQRDVYDVTQDPIYNIKSHETEAPPDLSQHVDHYLYGSAEK